MSAELWGMLHDGEIVGLAGAIPGEVELLVEIRYLRHMFDTAGDCFRVRLAGCERLAYTEYGEQPTADLGHIQELRPMILFVKSGSPLTIDCLEGVLELSYREAALALESGAPITDDQLAAACERYWREWEARQR